MTKKANYFFITTAILLAAVMPMKSVMAESSEIQGSGKVDLKASETSPIQDPEDPITSVDPNNVVASKGELRIDYASKVSFGKVNISDGEKKIPALAETFKTSKIKRGQFVQVTDQSGASSGWTLQVKQAKQFETKAEGDKKSHILKGAYLSFDKAWANSGGESEAPSVTRDTLGINSFDTAYEVASAKKGSGVGIWSLAFGASETNESGQPSTLREVANSTGEKEVVNSAITLNIPKETTIEPGEYITELVWIIGALPE